LADVAKTWVQMYLDSDVTDWEKQQLDLGHCGIG
jgi:hypothetical protein